MHMKNKIYKNSKNLLYNTRLHTKLLWIYFFLIILPLGLFMNISYHKVSNVMKEQTLIQAKQIFNDSVNIVEKKFNNCLTAIDIVSYDNTIYKICSENNENYTAVEQLIDSNKVTDNFSRIKSSTFVSDINLFINQDFVFSTENVNIFHVDTIKDSYWYKAMNQTSQNTVWFSPIELSDTTQNDQSNYSVIRRIYDISDFSNSVGFIKVSIFENNFKQLLEDSLITDNCCVFISKSDKLIQHVGVAHNIDFNQLYTQIANLSEDTWHKITFNKNRYFLVHHNITNTPYKKILLIPYSDILNESKSLLIFMLITMFIVAIVSYTIAVFISNSSIKRLYKLTTSMKKVESGNLSVQINVTGNDEIANLTKNFNTMIKRTEILVEEKYKLGQELKNQELKALQAQINPHFLYNSLNLINCIAIKNHIPDIVNTVNSLAKFYKISLSKGKDIITIREEIEHVKMYVNIQNMRFQNRINFILNIDDKVLDCKVIKIILQPIIENSIIHGIFEKPTKTGTVYIEVFHQNQNIVFKIKDDGIGMSSKKAEDILLDIDDVSGYGIKNVQKRIKINYGEQYGLIYNSGIGQGTEVTIIIPDIK